MTTGNLLDRIAESLQLLYLSELQTTPHDLLLEAIQRIDRNSYSLEQWNYALSYILSKKVRLQPEDEIIDLLETAQHW